jgi:hypothetical protein
VSEFHYVRTLGPDGGVDAVEGRAVGADLESLLGAGPPPFRVVLEIMAAICEILDIADEDGEVHGAMRPTSVRIDENGAVSIDGFGTRRATTYAPEGVPRGAATDMYGLGIVALRLFTGQTPSLPSAPSAHEDAVLDAVVSIDFSGMPDEMQRDVQWFLARMMAWEVDDRPSPLETWRTLIAFAGAVPGPELNKWSVDAANGRAERRPVATATPSAAPVPAGLAGPMVSAGPLKRGGLSFDAGGAKPGQATAFWSRDQMKAALDAAEREEEAHRPAPGGGAATAFWSRDQMQAMAEGRGDAPRPKRAPGGSEKSIAFTRSRSQERPTEPPARPKAEVLSIPPPKTRAPDDLPPRVPTPAKPAPLVVEGPAVRPPPPPPKYEEEADDPPASGGSRLVPLVIGVVVILLLAVVCAGFGAAGVGVAFWPGSDTPASVAPATSAAAEPAEPTEPTEPVAEPAPAEPAPTEPPPVASSSSSSAATSPTPSTSTSSSSTSSSSTPSKTPTTSSSSSSATASSSSSSTSSKTPTTSSSSSSTTSTKKPVTPPPPPPPPTGGPIVVQFRADQRGEMRCSDGQSIRFDGPTTAEFPSYAGTVTCAIFMDGGAKGFFQTKVAATVSCTTSGNDVSCTKS